ncbi:MAG: alpha/beta hydrolase [Vampirovibrio sp.]|nr:alpha/beta hydrolase [Vampirovibrio sp.]
MKPTHANLSNHSGTSQTGVLFLHGLFGASCEYDKVRPYFENLGYQTHAFDLPGHGENRHQALDEIDTDLIESNILKEYQEFAQSCDRIVIVGHSLGGACSLLLASHQPQKLAGVMTLAAPYEHGYYLNYTHGFLNVPVPYLLKGLTHYPDQAHPNIPRPRVKLQQVSGIRQQGNQVLTHIQGRLHQVEVPVSLVHSPYDLTVPYAEMEKLEQALLQSQVPRVETHTVYTCGHQIYPKSGATAQVTQLAHQFVESCIPVNTEAIQLHS